MHWIDKTEGKYIYNVKKDSIVKQMLLFWTFFSSKKPGKKIYHRFHKNIKQTVFNIDNN